MADAPLTPEHLLGHAAHVRELARRLVFDADLARDVEQETWIAALEHAPRDLRNPRAWLSQVVRHAARRLGKRRSRQAELEAGQARTGPEGDTGATPPELLEREQMLRTLLSAVGRLPEPVRTTIVLHHLDGLPLSEVATRVDAPLETVRSRSKRGLELLRTSLSDLHRDGERWGLGLVTALALEPLRPTRVSLSVARESLLSWFLMSSTLKTVAAFGGITLLVVSGVSLFGGDPPAGSLDAPGAAVAPAVLVQGTDAADPDVGTDASLSARNAVVSTPPVSAAGEEASSRGTLEVEVVWERDGTPAAGVPLLVERLDGRSGLTASWWTASPEGRLQLDEVRPGRYSVSALQGGAAWTFVEAGEHSAARLRIPIGLRVDGVVRAPDGAPVPGAAIFLSPGGFNAQFEGAVVAHTDAQGTFALPTVPTGIGACLSARAEGWAPTDQVVVTGGRGSEIELELVFPEPGRTLQGRVLAPDGTPLAGARVLLGPERDVRPLRRTDGTMAYPPIGQVVTTGPGGEFVANGAPQTSIPVQAGAEGFAPLQLEWAADDPSVRDLRLEAGGFVSGVVRSSTGDPLRGAWIRSGPRIFFATQTARSGDDGSYLLGPLASGPQALTASLQAVGEVDTRLQLTPGGEHVWDPVLGVDGLEIRGWVEAPGLELEGLVVRGYRWDQGGDTYVETVRTDSEGRFVLRQAPEGTVLLTASVPGAPIPVARRDEVVAGGSDVVLRVDPALVPTATARGSLVDAEGAPVRSADLWIRHETLGPRLVHPEPSSGSFELGPFPAGDWTLEVDPIRSGWAVTRVPFTLAAGEDLDLGAIELGPGGWVFVVLERSAEVEAPPNAEVLDADGRVVDWLTLEDDQATSRPLAPGTYTVRVQAASRVEDSAPFAVVVGDTAEVRVSLGG